MLAQLQAFTTATQLAWLLLCLAILIPMLGLTYGAAHGVRLEQLGGIMIAYWVFMPLSFVAFSIAVRGGDTEARKLRMITLASMAAPVALKIFAKAITDKFEFRPHEKPTAQVQSVSKGCSPQLICPKPAAESDSAADEDGYWGWCFFIGNSYKWRISVDFDADDTGAWGTASASGSVSPFYSFR